MAKPVFRFRVRLKIDSLCKFAYTCECVTRVRTACRSVVGGGGAHARRIVDAMSNRELYDFLRAAAELADVLDRLREAEPAIAVEAEAKVPAT